MSSGRIFKKATKGGRFSPWAETVGAAAGVELAIGCSDAEVEVLAAAFINDTSDQFKLCFFDTARDAVTETKLEDKEVLRKALPDVCMEFKYGLDRMKWHENSFCVLREGKEMWANYGTNSVLRVPDPSKLVTPIVFATGIESSTTFTAKWFTGSDATPKDCTLCASKAFKSEAEAQMFVVWHCKQNGIGEQKSDAETLREFTLADLTLFKARAIKDLVQALIDAVKEQKGLTYETLEQVHAQLPDLVVRLKEAGDAKLAICAAEMLHAREAIDALVKALSEKKAPPTKLFAKLVNDAWLREPKLLGYIERRHPEIAQRHERKLLRCVCNAACRQLVRMLRENKDTVTPMIASWMLKFPDRVGDGIQRALQKGLPDLFASYKNTWATAHATLLFDRLTDEKTFAIAWQRHDIINDALDELNVTLRRPVFEALHQVIASRIVDASRELSPLLATMCSFLRYRVLQHLEADVVVSKLLDATGAGSYGFQTALEALVRSQAEPESKDRSDDAAARDMFCLVLGQLLRLLEASPLILRAKFAVGYLTGAPVGSSDDSKSLLERGRQYLQKESAQTEEEKTRVWEQHSQQASIDGLMKQLALDDAELEAIADDAADEESTPEPETAAEPVLISSAAAPKTDLDQETMRDGGLPGSVPAETTDAAIAKDIAAVDAALAKAASAVSDKSVQSIFDELIDTGALSVASAAVATAAVVATREKAVLGEMLAMKDSKGNRMWYLADAQGDSKASGAGAGDTCAVSVELACDKCKLAGKAHKCECPMRSALPSWKGAGAGKS